MHSSLTEIRGRMREKGKQWTKVIEKRKVELYELPGRGRRGHHLQVRLGSLDQVKAYRTGH